MPILLSGLKDCASFAWLELFEEVVALVIHKDECREVFHFNLPDGLHAKFWIFYTFNALDVVLSENGSWASY